MVARIPRPFTGDEFKDRASLAIIGESALPWYEGKRRLMGFNVVAGETQRYGSQGFKAYKSWTIMRTGNGSYRDMASIVEGTKRDAWVVKSANSGNDCFGSFGDALVDALVRAERTRKHRGY